MKIKYEDQVHGIVVEVEAPSKYECLDILGDTIRMVTPQIKLVKHEEK